MIFYLIRYLRARIKGFEKNTDGAYTLEASLVMPMLCMCTLFVLLFAVLETERVVTYFRSSVAAERVAFNWANSSKNEATGAYPYDHHDGLYRRIFEDGVLQRLFQLDSSGSGNVSLPFPHGTEEENSLPIRKLRTGAAALSIGMQGELLYRNDGGWGTVIIQSRTRSLYEPILRLRGQAEVTASVRATALEPVEWIRSTDLLRYFAAKMKKSEKAPSVFRSEARTVLRKAGGAP